ncbi:MAG: SgcJ/EcaC family oxidoreductase, partial [Parachlamydia sp.]|nr:SgcJ/EcaC family oxidoreductase [Parachlamydia sp.]
MGKFTKIVLTLFTGVWLASCGQQQSDKASENEVRKTTQVYQDAFNQKDASKLAALWAPDATYINPVTGETADGREAIEKLYKDKFAQDKNRHLEVSVKSVEFPNPDEAVERGVMKVTAPDQPTKQMAYAVGYVRENGKWLVSDINEIELQEAPDNSEHLMELAWLIGKWEDSDDNVEITFDNQWDKNKNFIIQHFNMT